eukprot:3372684-Alexandrium_andersonii.AAC.1
MAACLEKAKLDAQPFVVASTGVYKYFEQISRLLLFSMLSCSVFPPALIVTYASFVDSVSYYNAMGL